VGKEADFIILNQNPFKIKEADIHRVKVLKTFIGGKLAFSSS